MHQPLRVGAALQSGGKRRSNQGANLEQRFSRRGAVSRRGKRRSAALTRFCVFWIRNTIRNVTIVVPVLMASCQVSEN
jgi:hypothetical protein